MNISYLQTQLNIKTVLFQTIQFSVSNFFMHSIKVKKFLSDTTLLGPTTLSQSGPMSDGNKGILRIPQSSSITRASSSGCLIDETDCISHSTITLGKGMNPIILPPAMGK